MYCWKSWIWRALDSPKNNKDSFLGVTNFYSGYAIATILQSIHDNKPYDRTTILNRNKVFNDLLIKMRAGKNCKTDWNEFSVLMAKDSEVMMNCIDLLKPFVEDHTLGNEINRKKYAGCIAVEIIE